MVAYDSEPTFKNNLLVYGGRYFKIGEGHKEFIADKIQDEDYYILTLAAIAREMNIRKIYSTKVHIAAGLPLTWVREQRESFRKYLLQNEAADFSFNGKDYHVQFVGADVFPQGFAAVANRLGEFSGMNMLADIGNGTMNVMYINDRMPQEQKCYTEKYGVNQCMLAVKENLMKQFGVAVDESVIERVFRFGTAEISERFLACIRQTATAYVQGIFRKLREHEYNPELMRLFVVGGGACLIRNFAEYGSKAGHHQRRRMCCRKRLRDDGEAEADESRDCSMVKERETINTNIRLNLANPDDREAWEHLRHMDRKKYKSYSRAVVIAVNDYFGRAERAEADPYLETREKEDAFLLSVSDAVEKGAKEAMPMVILNTLIGLLQSAAVNGQIAANPQSFTSESDEASSENNKQEASLDDALSFADNF